MLSQDGTRAGFTGVSLGGALPYGVLDDAGCVYGRRHRPPARRCDCGFHHDRTAAEALLCTAGHRAAVLLEVSVLGAYIRFERGFRYARQRVRTATAGPCACGVRAVALAEFARLAGQGLRVVAGGAGTGFTPAGPMSAAEPGVPELVAEAALLQARLDWLQSQLARLGERGTGSGAHG
ncbi:hypothetical protein ACFVY4_15640 [Streptomyces sp. NPDC058299]|uniref:hypothetical protein n=1 Tax=Streptomyces sp. NPDC058299 TaxID=3346435 RepID=UPI0036ED398A